MPPNRLFLKVDSVLLGPIRAELKAILNVTGKRRAIVVSANPSRGRVIREGRYFIDGTPLDQTEFSRDPQYPAQTADIVKLLGAGDVAPVVSCLVDAPLPREGIVIGDALHQCDLDEWARRLDADTLAAGAADFFAAALRLRRVP